METRPEHPAEPHPIVPTPSHPALNAMLICDVAFQDEASGKTSLIGVFETVTAFQFPARHGRLCVYAKLTDAQGEYRLRLELVRLEELKVVGRGQLGATFADRMTAIELSFQLWDTFFEAPGRYEFRLYANDRWVGSKSLNVIQAPEAKLLPEQIRVFGSTVSVRWLNFMLPVTGPAPGAE
jgi:hypothetical protein